MANNFVHPHYTRMLPVWIKMKDCYAGENAIKAKRDTYLAPTSGMKLDGQGSVNQNAEGNKSYQAYLDRAYFPEAVEEAVQLAIGVMHSKPSTIEVPSRLSSLLKTATDTGEDLSMLLRKINSHQMTTGRLGLLGDIRVKPGEAPMPTIVLYDEMCVQNWDDILVDQDSSELRFVMLDESGDELAKDSFQWVRKEKYKVISLITADGKMAFAGEPFVGVGVATLGPGDNPAMATYTQIQVQGTSAKAVPFVFCNTKDLSSVPDKPPLDGLANLCLAAYRQEADYRQNLHMQGQDTLVIVGNQVLGEGETIRTGAGSCIKTSLGGDAKYIGVNSQGLSEQRICLENDYKRAESKTAKLMNDSGRESGDALRIRVAAQTATLNQIAIAGAAALQEVLRHLAIMFDEDPEQVVVTPNLEFAEIVGDGLTLKSLVEAKAMGAKISDESIHTWAREQGFTKLSYDEELASIGREEPDSGLLNNQTV